MFRQDSAKSEEGWCQKLSILVWIGKLIRAVTWYPLHSLYFVLYGSELIAEYKNYGTLAIYLSPEWRFMCRNRGVHWRLAEFITWKSARHQLQGVFLVSGISELGCRKSPAFTSNPHRSNYYVLTSLNEEEQTSFMIVCKLHLCNKNGAFSFFFSFSYK